MGSLNRGIINFNNKRKQTQVLPTSRCKTRWQSKYFFCHAAIFRSIDLSLVKPLFKILLKKSPDKHFILVSTNLLHFMLLRCNYHLKINNTT